MFKVGDIVIGLGREKGIPDYAYTHKGSICEVVDVISEEGILVKIIECKVIREIGNKYEVNPEYFELKDGKYKGMSSVLRKINMIYDKQRQKGIQI